jgi:hypothetical protein
MHKTGLMRFFVLASATMLAVCVGCSGADKAPERPAPLGNGPLTAGGGHASLCMPIPVTGHDASIGDNVVWNKDTTDAVITGVSAVDAKNLQIDETFIVHGKGANYGGSPTWPPTQAGYKGLDALWKTRRPAVGQRIGPPDGKNFNLVVHAIRDDGTQAATLRAIRVDYTVGGQPYWLETAISYVLKEACP